MTNQSSRRRWFLEFTFFLAFVGGVHAQPVAAGAVIAPARGDIALRGAVLATINVSGYAACQAECKRVDGCTGYTFVGGKSAPALLGSRNSLMGGAAARQPANCTLMAGKLDDVATVGAVSCRMPCEATAVAATPSVIPLRPALGTIQRDAAAVKEPPAASASPLLPIAPVKAGPMPVRPMTLGAIVPPAPPAPAPASRTPILVGTGIGDITGPVAEVVMMGYANGEQISSGLLTRLYARAFIFASPGNGRRVVFVSAELGQLFSSIKQGVLKRLAQRYGNLYDDSNVQIAATHTHAGPGGYSHHAIYNFSSHGHVAQNYAAIVDGVTQAIIQAHDRIGPATLSLASGNIIAKASVNRSEQAFVLNSEVRSPVTPPGAPPPPPGLPPQPPSPVNPEMSVLRIDKDGRAAGAISWFSVHNTSLTQTNRLVSSDHKGYAAYQMEKLHGSIAPFQSAGGFVAAFPNGDEGDMSPNIDPGFRGPGGNEFAAMKIIGNIEFDTAELLFSGPNRMPVDGDIDFRHTFVRMPGFPVAASKFTNGSGGTTLCSGAFGASFAAGAEDGPTGFPLFHEGMALGPNLTQAQLTALRIAFGEVLFATVSGPAQAIPGAGALIGPLHVAYLGVTALSSDPCQFPKPVLIPTGQLGWSPEVLPFQLLRVGPVVIAGVPGEMTTQAGRRLRARILASLQSHGVQKVIITGLANEYSGYITTPEEYNSQQYEGASTLYGRLTFEAYLQIFGQLADAMATGQPMPAGSPAPDLSAVQIELQTGVVADGVPGGQVFGSVLTEPPISVRKNDTVQVRFRGAHPKNDLKRNDTYLRVERNGGGANWSLVAWDSMPETRLIWQRDTSFGCIGCSFIDVHWTVPDNASPGTYRIRHMGRWKNGITGAITPYEGVTSTFEVGSALVARTPPAPVTVTACGGVGQRACCVSERIPSCNAGLQEASSCGGGSNCTCGGPNPGGAVKSIGMCVAIPQAVPISACGGQGQRACCVSERFPSCNTGLHEKAGCVDANCTCGGPNPGAAVKSNGMCVR